MLQTPGGNQHVGMACKQTMFLRILLNILLIALVFLLVTVLELDLGVRPFKQGFYCNDESLSKPYRDSTVPTVVVICVGTGLNLVVIAIFERLAAHRERTNLNETYGYQRGSFLFTQEMIQFYEVFLVFLFGTAIQQGTTNITKFMTGRLRPHFLDICRPNYTAFSCVDERGQPRYITEDVCTGPYSYKALDMRLSFPSGHASLATYCMVFLVMYIQVRMQPRRLHLMKAALQVAALWLALCTCLSRVSDYKHHWTDVVAGALLGGVVAILMVKCVLGLSSKSSVQTLTIKDREDSGSSSLTSY